jgi:hypothetical protein
MSMKTIVENGTALELTALQKQTDFGIAYWQARYSFQTGAGTARMHGIRRCGRAGGVEAGKKRRVGGWPFLLELRRVLR